MANAKILEQKSLVVDEIKGKFENAKSVVVFDPRGLNVAEVTELRRALRESGSDYKVYKNTLVKRAVNSLDIKLDELFDKGILKGEIFAQIGTSKYKPKNYKYKDFISQEEFLEYVNKSDVVVSHGASGSIMKALNAGKKVIAVTRLAKYGEHIDNHQIQNNEAFGENKYVIPVYEMEDLEKAFKSIEDGTADLIPWENKDPMAIINLIDNFIKQNWN